MQSGSALHFNTIVVATDLSDSADAALRYAQAIARLHKSLLVAVHVIDPVSYAFPNGAPAFAVKDQSARKELRRIENETRRQGILFLSVLETGVIYERILQAVADHGADLLVVGTRAETGLGRAALGTVAGQLLAKSTCPILTVSPSAGALLPSAGRWRQVLAATDFSSASLKALTYAHRIAHEKLVAMHVPSHCEQHKCAVSLERLRFLAPFNESHTVPVEHIVAPGEADAVIAEYAQHSSTDLIVLGVPAKELTAEDLSASTVLRVISQVSIPVLCVGSDSNLSSQKSVGEGVTVIRTGATRTEAVEAA